MRFDQVDRNRAFIKTYTQKRMFLQPLAHFNHMRPVLHPLELDADLRTFRIGGEGATLTR